MDQRRSETHLEWEASNFFLSQRCKKSKKKEFFVAIASLTSCFQPRDNVVVRQLGQEEFMVFHQ